MRIQKIDIDCFGKLQRVSFTPASGITVITGSNEAGKSTLAAFLRYMLFGFNGKSPSVADNDRKKYTCWDSGKCAGAMTIQCDGDSEGRNRGVFRIERESAQRSVARIVDASGSPYDCGQSAGEYFFEMDEAAFVRTAFIGQLDPLPDSAKKLAPALQNIVFSANEKINADAARKKLVAMRNTFYNSMRKTGIIFELDARIASLNEARDQLTAAHKELLSAEFALTEVRDKLQDNSAKLERLYSERDDLDALDAEDTLRELHQRRANLKRALDARNRARTAAMFGDYLPDRAFCSALSLCADRTQDAFARAHAALTQYEEAKARYETAFDDPELQRFAAQSDAFDAFDAAGAERGLRALQKKARRFLVLAVGLTVPVITLPFAILFYLLWSRAKKEIRLLCASYDCESPEQLERLISAFPAARADTQKAASEVSFAKKTYEREWEHFLSLRGELSVLLAKVGYDLSKDTYPQGEVDALVQTVLEKIEAMERADAEYQPEQAAFDAFLAQCDEQGLTERTRAYSGRPPERSRPDVLREIDFYEKANGALSLKERDLEKRAGILSATVRKPADVASELDCLNARLAEAKQKRDALTLAIGALDEALVDVKKNLAPRIAERASDYFSYLTDNRYAKLEMNDEFDLSFSERDGALARDLAYLSAGTSDAAYLSLRLALVEALFRERPFLVFDDAFVKLDNERLNRMCSLLLELSQRYQIFLFTCHDREANLLQHRSEVIRL